MMLKVETQNIDNCMIELLMMKFIKKIMIMEIMMMIKLIFFIIIIIIYNPFLHEYYIIYTT